jgi:dTDP-4-amino-4,6-dideoxygalactose transaminase
MELVNKFEREIADFYGAPFAVATDSCTHAIELCLRHKPPAPGMELTIPARTYISVPFTLMKLDLSWKFFDQVWQDHYYIGGTNIVDAAVFFKAGGYIKQTFMCLSFQFKKTLSLGRGGAILCDNEKDYVSLKKMSYDGRCANKPWKEQNIDSMGYHYYMTPETAELGSQKLKDAVAKPSQGSGNYPYLPDMDVFKNRD